MILSVEEGHTHFESVHSGATVPSAVSAPVTTESTAAHVPAPAPVHDSSSLAENQWNIICECRFQCYRTENAACIFPFLLCLHIQTNIRRPILKWLNVY